jgi:hypothetical protein
MFHPGAMPWYPPMPPPFPRRNKTPHQLKRIQNRTEKFKSGEVKRFHKNFNHEPLIPSQDKIRLEVPNQSVHNPSTSDNSCHLTPATVIIPSTCSVSGNEIIPTKADHMKQLSLAQKLEMNALALKNNQLFPPIVINRGVLASELFHPDEPLPVGEIPFNPSSMIVSYSDGIRAVRILEDQVIYGPQSEKTYIPSSPPQAAGLSMGHINRILYKAFQKKKDKKKQKVLELFSYGTEEIVHKAAKMKLSKDQDVVSPIHFSSDDIPEGMDTNNSLSSASNPLPSEAGKSTISESDEEMILSDATDDLPLPPL